MKAKLPGVLMAMLLIGAMVPAVAHHSFSVEFDGSKCLDLQGTLTSLTWENPHPYIHMDVKNADGKTVSWSLEMHSPNSLKGNGTFRQDFEINFGKIINVRACPARFQGPDRMRGAAEYLQLADGEIRSVGQEVERRPPDQRHF
jgi:hypothetical protein